jgi:hypothetical protein
LVSNGGNAVRRLFLAALVGVLALFAACAPRLLDFEPLVLGTGGTHTTTASTGGGVGTGGMAGSTAGTGGMVGTGGMAGTGGMVGTGGMPCGGDAGLACVGLGEFEVCCNGGQGGLCGPSALDGGGCCGCLVCVLNGSTCGP